MRIKTYCLAALLLGALLSACGGGSGDETSAGATPDGRNGTYTAFAANGRQYTATVNFNAGTVSFSDGAATTSGSFSARSGSTTQFELAAGNGEGFITTTDAFVGRATMPSGGGIVPFVAARSFATTVAEAVGTYTSFGRDTDSKLNTNSVIFPSEITADGKYQSCFTSAIYTVASCPSLSTYTLTISGPVFTAVSATATASFSVAKIGTERVYLRASANGDGRRFTIGLPNTTAYAAGTFDAYGSESSRNLSYSTDGATSFTLTGTADPSTPFSVTGTVTPVGAGPSGLRGVQTPSDGGFFSTRASTISAVIAGRDSTAHPGLIILGVRR